MNQPHVDRQVGHLLAAHLTAGPRPLVDGLDVFPLVCPVGEGGGAARHVTGQPLPFAVHDAHVLGQLFHLHQVEGVAVSRDSVFPDLNFCTKQFSELKPSY